MSQDYLVSVITPAFNCEPFLKQTYSCLVRQSFHNWEWIVTDDCSQDETLAALKKISRHDNRVKVMEHSVNLGAALSRNTAIKASSGRYIAFLDSDDFWDSTKLQSQISFMSKNDIALSFTPFRIVNELEESLDIVWDKNAPSEISYYDLLKKKAIFGCSTVIVDREKTGLFQMPNLRTGQDYATWLMLLKKGNIACKYPEPLSYYRLVQGSLSRNKLKKAARQWQIYREQEKLGFGQSSYYFLNYAFRALFRP